MQLLFIVSFQDKNYRILPLWTFSCAHHKMCEDCGQKEKEFVRNELKK